MRPTMKRVAVLLNSDQRIAEAVSDYLQGAARQPITMRKNDASGGFELWTQGDLNEARAYLPKIFIPG